MPLLPFLNALRQVAGGLPAPSQRGTWSAQADFLTKYAKSVNIGNDELDVASLAHSVPSVFQRPIQFHRAIADKESPLHRAVTGEWRGLMTVFCLADWLGLRLTVEEFAVPEINEESKSSVGSQIIGDLHFRAMLRYQLPTRRVELHEKDAAGNDIVTIKRISDWEKWWVIKCNDTLLGATSPWTLVYTASRYQAPAAIDWLSRDNRLIDPIDHYDPDKKRQPCKALAILHAWVEKLLADRPKWNYDPNLGAYSSLLYIALTAWSNELAPYSQQIALKGNSISYFPRGSGPYGAVLSTPTRLDENDSDIYVDTKLGKVLLFYDDMPPTARVNGGTRGDRVDVTKLSPEGDSLMTRDGVLIRQKFIVASKFFFPQKLLRLDLASEAFRPANVSTPLKPGFFKYFGHEQLQGLSITDINGRCTVKLRLVLANDTQIVITRIYDKDDFVRLDGFDNPALALWPRDYDLDWKHHFAAYAAPPSDLLVRPILADGAPAANESDGRSRHEINKVRIWHLEQPAIGFALRMKMKKEGDPVPTFADLGLVLRAQIESGPRIVESRSWQIGVDFGTSSTSVMVNKGDGRIVEMPFPAHMLPLIDPLKTTGAQDSISWNLYPQTDVSSPFRTLLYNAYETAVIFGGDGAYTMRFTSAVKNDLVNKPVENLKWGIPANFGENPLNAYLTALVRYIVWEARSHGVKKVELGWSYPTSLPRHCLSAMREFWGSLQNRSWHSAMDVSVVREMSESEATCRSITGPVGRVRTNVLTITVDIGGGSTDIAFWSAQALLNQVSFKLAGNDMLDRAFLDGDTLLKFFHICAPQDLGQDPGEKMQDRPEIFANAALAEAQIRVGEVPQKHPLPNYIYDRGLQSTAPWLRFRSLIYLFFTGLAYYLGVKARAFAIDSPEIDVYFGGRGSSMLTWLSNNGPTLTNALNHAFTIGLMRAADDGVAVKFEKRASTSIQFHGQALKFDRAYPMLKTEVASGLLLSPKMVLKSEPLISVSADEKGWTKNNLSVAWTDALLPEDLALLKAPNESAFDNSSIGYFRWEILHEDKIKSLQDLNVDKDRLQKLNMKGDDVVNIIRKESESDDRVLQPIFAYELKALMLQYAAME